MTVTSEISRVTYAGNGSTKLFPVPFYFLADADLVVGTQDLVGLTETSLALNVGFTVAGAGDEDGGSITTSVAVPAGTRLVIYRDPPITQDATFVDHAKFPAASVEQAFDKDRMIDQRTRELVERAPRLRDTDVDGSGAYQAGGNRISALGAPLESNDAARAVDIQNIVAAAGSTPAPLLGQVGKFLKATATGVFGWVSPLINDIADATTIGKGLLGAADEASALAALLSAADLEVFKAAIKKLPPLPLQARCRVMGIGDSTNMMNNSAVQQTWGVFPTYSDRMAHGVMQWAMAASGNRFDMPQFPEPGEIDSGSLMSGFFTAFAAEPEETVVARLRRHLAVVNPAIVVVFAGVNNPELSLPAGNPAGTSANVISLDKQIAATCLAAGAYVVFTSLPPKSVPGTVWPLTITPDPGKALDDPYRTRAHEVNDSRAAMAAASPSGAIKFVDLNPYVRASDDQWLPLCSEDGVHFSMYGAQPCGVLGVAPVLNSMISPPDAWPWIYDSTVYNLLPNGRLSGNTGNKDANVAGEVADGYNISRTRGAACTATGIKASHRTDALGSVVFEQQISIALAGSDDYVTFTMAPISQFIARPQFPDGTLIRLDVNFEWNANGAWRGIMPFLNIVDAVDATTLATSATWVATQASRGMANLDPVKWKMNPSGSPAGGLRFGTNPLRIDALTQRVFWGFIVHVSNVGNPGGVPLVKISDPILRPYRDPNRSGTV